MTPPEMTDEQIIEASEDVWGSELDYKHLAEIKFAQAIIAARDKQWSEMLGEPVAWIAQHDETGRTTFVDQTQLNWGWAAGNTNYTVLFPLYAPKQEKPE